MADIKTQISNDVKEAMRNKDKERLAALRFILAAFKQKEVDERIELNDQQSISILNKMAKQHRDSIEQFSKANRDDLIIKEQQELAIIELYLPKKLSSEKINLLIEEAISEANANSLKDMGKVMGFLKEKLQGRADMSEVSKLIKDKLGN